MEKVVITADTEILTPVEVCAKLKICRSTFQRRVKAGSIRVVKQNRKVYVRMSELLEQLSIHNIANQ